MTGYKFLGTNLPFLPNEFAIWTPGGRETIFVPKEHLEKALQRVADLEAEIRYLKAELKLAKLKKQSYSDAGG